MPAVGAANSAFIPLNLAAISEFCDYWIVFFWYGLLKCVSEFRVQNSQQMWQPFVLYMILKK